MRAGRGDADDDDDDVADAGGGGAMAGCRDTVHREPMYGIIKLVKA